MVKTRSTQLVFGLVTVLVCNLAFGQDDYKENVKTFMRAKLTHSQKALEGLTTEDFGSIEKGAQQLSLLSLAAQWRVIQTPEYARRSAEFRREVDALKKAAAERKLDSATLSYVKVTMNCIECHKYVRSVREASLREPASQNSLFTFD